MKVLFFLGSFSSDGGIGRVVSILGNYLVKKYDVEISFLCYGSGNRETFIYEIEKEIRVYGWDETHNMSYVMLNGGIKKLRSFLKNNKFDIVFACGALFFPISSIACLGLKTKCICWEHSNANNDKDHRYQKAARLLGSILSDGVLTITKQDKCNYKTHYKTKHIYQIYNPLDPEAFQSNKYDANSKKIISVGRLTYQKNYDALIEIAKDVLSVNDGWIWEIFGSGPEEKRIKEMIDEYDLSNRIFLKGQVNNIYNLYGEYAFLVLTSRYEGFGMALIEAEANGLPIVSFDVECGPREIIKDSINGFLISPLDFDEMIEKINLLCKDDNLRKQMSANSLCDVERFSLKNVANEWFNLFNEVCSK